MGKFEDGIYNCLPGKALIGKVLAGRCEMHYIRVAVGKGKIPDGTSPKEIWEPPDYVMDGKIASITNPVDGECQVTVQINSSDVEHGFYCTGIMLYAEDPDDGEIPYTYLRLEDGPEWIRPASSAVGKMATFDLIAAVGDVDTVDADIAPDAIVTKDMLKEVMTDHNDSKHANTELISITHNLDCYPDLSVFAYQYGAGMGNGPAGGTNLMEIPTKIEYSGKDSLTIYTTKSAAKPDIDKSLHKISDTEYVITYQDNETDAIYIRLIPEQKETSFTKIATIPHRMGVYPGVFAAVVNYGAGVGGAGNGPAGGTSIKPLPVQVEYPDRNTISISSALSFDKPALWQISREEYTVTFEDNKSLSIYLRLLPNGGSTQVIDGISVPNTSVTAEDNVTIQNMVFSAIAPEDKSLIWGKI